MRKYYYHYISSTPEPTLRASLLLPNNARHSIALNRVSRMASMALPASTLVMNRMLEKDKKCESGGFGTRQHILCKTNRRPCSDGCRPCLLGFEDMPVLLLPNDYPVHGEVFEH